MNRNPETPLFHAAGPGFAPGADLQAGLLLEQPARLAPAPAWAPLAWTIADAFHARFGQRVLPEAGPRTLEGLPAPAARTG